MNKKDLKGRCPSKGNQVQFRIAESERGSQAVEVEVLVAEEELSYCGEIKSFNPSKGGAIFTVQSYGWDILFPTSLCGVLTFASYLSSFPPPSVVLLHAHSPLITAHTHS